MYAFSGAAGVLYINPAGTMLAYGGNASSYTSLAGISYPAAESAPPSQPFSLVNGWQSSQGEYNTGDPAYFVSGGIVHLSGSMHNPAPSASSEFAQIPPAAEPGGSMYLFGQGQACDFLISLSGISYRVTS